MPRPTRSLALLALLPTLGLAACGGGDGGGGVVTATTPPTDTAGNGGGGDGGGTSSGSGGSVSNSNTVEGGQSNQQSNSGSSTATGETATSAAASAAPLSGQTLAAERGKGVETIGMDPMSGAWRLESGPDATLTYMEDGSRILALPDGRQATLSPGGAQTFTGDAGGQPLVLTSHGALANLSYSDYGSWALDDGNGLPASAGVYAVGLPTPLASMPTTGSADFQGGAAGIARVSGGNYSFVGATALHADFAEGTISGAISGIEARAATGGAAMTMNDIGLNGTIAGRDFAGAATPAAAPGQLDIGRASGSFAGGFNGPGAVEAAGTFALEDGDDMVTGSFGAIRR